MIDIQFFPLVKKYFVHPDDLCILRQVWIQAPYDQMIELK